MEDIYYLYHTGSSRPGLTRSSSLPLFNEDPNNYNSTVSPNTLKIQQMEERLNHLEKLKYQQNDKINALISYQMNKNKLRNIYVPNVLILSEGGYLLPSIGYHLNNTQPIEKKYYIIKTDKNKYKKERKLNEYKNNIDNLKYLLKKERNKRRVNKNIRNNIYMKIRKDINNSMDEINYNIQKKLQQNNNIIHSKINDVQNSYDEAKYLLNKKMDKLELKQKIDFENLKNDIINTANQNQKERDILNKYIENQLDNSIKKYSYDLEEQIRSQRELDDIKHQKELEALKHRHELEEMKNKIIMENIRFKKMRNCLLNQRKRMIIIPNIIQRPPIYMIHQYSMPFM